MTTSRYCAMCDISYNDAPDSCPLCKTKKACKDLIECIDEIEHSICCSIPYEQIQTIVKVQKLIEEIEKRDKE